MCPLAHDCKAMVDNAAPLVPRLPLRRRLLVGARLRGAVALRRAFSASSSATLVRSAAFSFSISHILRARIRSEIFAIECDVMSQGVFFFQKSQNFFHFFDESQSEKMGRKMRIEFRYAGE